MPSDLAALLPSTVDVHFRPWPCGTGKSFADVPADDPVAIALADAGLPTATGSGAKAAVRDSCHQANGNDSTLKALAKVIVRDQLGMVLTAYDRIFPGIVAPKPDATAGAITWNYRVAGASTRASSESPDGEPTSLGHADPAHDCDARPLVYGGTDHATVKDGTLTIPRQRLEIRDGVLRWYKRDPESLVICPQS